MATADWLTDEFYLPSSGAILDGLYDFYYTPYLLGVAAALDDSKVEEVDLQKAAQIGWTYFLIGYLGKRIACDPCPIIVLFAKEKDGKAFHDEKLVPAVQATPAVRSLMDVSTSRKSGNRWDHKTYGGGFLKLVGSNSPGNVKSTSSVGLVVVEEPDDTSEDVKGQGDSIRLAEERLKRYVGSKLVVGGTPAVAGLSKVQQRVESSDARVLPVACHVCGEKHVLAWENVTWEGKDGPPAVDEGTGEVLGERQEVYGWSRPETARYQCPHCTADWDDYQRQKNVRDTVYAAIEAGDPNCGWVATKPFQGKAGFRELSELYACLPGTVLADVVRDFLEAEHKADQGDEADRIVFVNSKLGRPYEYRSDGPDRDALEARAEDYAENSVPRGGLVLTAGIDVQHDRLAVLIDAWGRDEESWTIFAGEIYGAVINPKDSVWTELDKILFARYQAEAGMGLRISAAGIDSSDGTTSDAVYAYVRSRQRRGGLHLMAVKGSSNDYGNREIFSRPKTSIDTKGKKHTKADRYGLTPYIVGTHKAKDLLAARMKLEGRGPGRWHWYKDIRADFFDQITGEVKAPHRSLRGRRVWQQKAGQPVEFWDCKVYSLHASRAAKVHLLNAAKWDALEARLRQADLFGTPSADTPEDAPAETKQAPKPKAAAGGWVETEGDWI